MMKCPNCGGEISKEWLSKEKSCPNCGASLKASKGKLVRLVEPAGKQAPSPWWYFVAYVGMIVGGYIGYRRVKDRDMKMAKMLLLIGALATVLEAVMLTLYTQGIIQI